MNNLPSSQAKTLAMMGRLAYFQEFAPTCLARLSACAWTVSLRRGEVLFRKGERAEAVYIVVSGQIKVCLDLPNDAERVVALLERDHSIGEASALSGNPHQVNASAAVDSHLLLLDKGALQREMRHDCVIANRVLQAVSEQFNHLLRNMEACAHRSALQRVACYLITQHESRDHSRFDVYLNTTKRVIAAKLNLTQETFSRVLQYLSKEGLIEVEGRVIRILDAARLGALRPLEKPCLPEQSGQVP